MPQTAKNKSIYKKQIKKFCAYFSALTFFLSTVLSTSLIFKAYHIPNSLCNPIIRLTPNREISFSPIRCAAPDADADRKVSARLSQMQQLLQEAEERASSAGNEPTPQITLDHVTVSFARSGGPGGQNVNKVNTKVDMRFNVKQAYWLSDRIRVRIMQMVCHCHLLSFKEFMILLIVCLRDKN
uniref:Prokaryotic-type class I peptide chain release factors domain-containing protein n=1 Tax=Gossypium raimondii TaxID=29730 RepID=A0A0D2PUV6_GOSRA|nr:hypothetical protein B456_005G179200 [Gossypium raimondii]